MASHDYTFGFLEAPTAFHFGGASLPVYVAVTAHADRSGLSTLEAPLHDAVFTLSPGAVKKGATVVQDFGINGNFFGNRQYFKTWVAKVPRLVTGTLFTLDLSGVHHLRDLGGAPDYFCGTFTSAFHRDLVGPVVLGGLTFYKYHIYNLSTYPVFPSGTGSRSDYDYYDFFGRSDLAESSFDSQSFLCYYSGGAVYKTAYPCDHVFETPGLKPEDFPFDLQVQINPVQNHTVTNPGYAYDTGAVVHHLAAGPFDGDDTAIWANYVSAHTNPLVSGILDCSLDFHMRNHALSTAPTRKNDRFIEVYPMSTDTFAARTVYYTVFGRPRIRLNKPIPTFPPIAASCRPWRDERFDPTFNTELFSGSPPPTVSFDPFVSP